MQRLREKIHVLVVKRLRKTSSLELELVVNREDQELAMNIDDQNLVVNRDRDSHRGFKTCSQDSREKSCERRRIEEMRSMKKCDRIRFWGLKKSNLPPRIQYYYQKNVPSMDTCVSQPYLTFTFSDTRIRAYPWRIVPVSVSIRDTSLK